MISRFVPDCADLSTGDRNVVRRRWRRQWGPTGPHTHTDTHYTYADTDRHRGDTDQIHGQWGDTGPWRAGDGAQQRPGGQREKEYLRLGQNRRKVTHRRGRKKKNGILGAVISTLCANLVATLRQKTSQVRTWLLLMVCEIQFRSVLSISPTAMSGPNCLIDDQSPIKPA